MSILDMAFAAIWLWMVWTVKKALWSEDAEPLVNRWTDALVKTIRALVGLVIFAAITLALIYAAVKFIKFAWVN